MPHIYELMKHTNINLSPSLKICKTLKIYNLITRRNIKYIIIGIKIINSECLMDLGIIGIGILLG